jgi:murein DD-endopeptidase MepM/ murein hydrolase activator NlpD
VRISSLFQLHRFHPIKKFRKPHTGIDFELAEGEPVYSAEAGTILRTGRTHGAGNFVAIRHRNGYETFYDHLSSIEKFIPGQPIKAGVVVGKIGCTGYCTAPHLHFAIKKNGQFVNPIYLIRNYSYLQRNDVSHFFTAMAD